MFRKTKKFAKLFIVAAIIGALCLPLFSGCNFGKKGDDQVKVHFININRIGSVNNVGDCILIQFRGINILIDSGEDNQTEKQKSWNQDLAINHQINYMKEAGVKNLDYIIISHPHSDHISSLRTIIREFPVTKAVFGYEPDWNKTHQVEFEWRSDALWYDMAELVSRQIAPSGDAMSITEPEEKGWVYNLDKDSDLQFFYLGRENQLVSEDLNHMSMQVVFRFKDFKVFLGGDGDSKINDQIINADVGHCQIYNAQHHSAEYNADHKYSTMPLLNHITPSYTVITGNRVADEYWSDNGLNGSGVNRNIDRLFAAGGTIYSTARNGDILVTSDGSKENFTIRPLGEDVTPITPTQTTLDRLNITSTSTQSAVSQSQFYTLNNQSAQGELYFEDLDILTHGKLYRYPNGDYSISIRVSQNLTDNQLRHITYTAQQKNTLLLGKRPFNYTTQIINDIETYGIRDSILDGIEINNKTLRQIYQLEGSNGLIEPVRIDYEFGNTSREYYLVTMYIDGQSAFVKNNKINSTAKIEKIKFNTGLRFMQYALWEDYTIIPNK